MLTRVVFCLLLAFACPAPAAVLFPTNSTWNFLRGTNEASTPDTLAWTRTNTVPRSFLPADAPFYVGDEGTSGGTLLGDMPGSYGSFFLQKPFFVADSLAISALRFSYQVGDGVVVWINGHEILRDNVAPGAVTRNTLAAAPRSNPGVFTNILVTPASAVLLDGSNSVAVQYFNDALSSPTARFDAALESLVAESIPPGIAAVSPPPGTVTALSQITVTFSEPVIGVNADDFLLNTQPASSVTGGGTTYTFHFSQPDFGAVFITWFPTHGILDEALVPNSFSGTGPGETWSYLLRDTVAPFATSVFPPPGATVRALTQVEVVFSEEVNGVTAGDLLVNGQPAASVSRTPGGPYLFQFPSPAAGVVNLSWVAGAGIADLAVPPNGFAGGSWTCLLDPAAVVGNVVINEVLASNLDGLADEEGEPQDWVEIQNRGTTPVNLAGWSLSDDPDVPGLWVFPARTLAPGSYLVVFASGKDRAGAAAAAPLHTNFKLGEKGFVGLYNSDSPRLQVQGLDYPAQRNNFSYGFDPSGLLRYYARPTPGAANGVSFIDGVTEPVHFSTTRGHFTQPFTLRLSSPTPGAEIRYTTNGAEPTLLNSLPYLEPLTVAGTKVVRATAFRTNLLPSTVSTHSFFFNQSAAIRSLPVVSIVTAVSNLYGRSGILGIGGGSRASDGLFITNNPATDYHNPSAHGIAWERQVSTEWIRPEDNSGFQIDAGLRVQGSDWQRPRTLPESKFSLRLYFRPDYGRSRVEYPLFPGTTLQSYDQMVLRAGYNESANPFVRDELSRRLFADMGQVSAVGTFVQLFTNGFYAGYYNPTERVHEEFCQAHHGGSNQWDVVGPDFALSSEGPGVVDGDRSDFINLHNYINGQSATAITNPVVYTEIGRRLDLVNFVDYCLLNVFAAMGDWPANNWRAGRDRGPGGIWRFYVWDAEWGFGYAGRGFTRDSFAESGPGPDTSGLGSSANSEIARIYQSLRRNPEFRLLWADRIQKHFFNSGALTELAITNRLVDMRTELASVFSMTMSELGPFMANRRTNVFPLFEKYGLFGLSNAVQGFYASSNAPVFSQHGGPVAPGYLLGMTAPLGGTIYYTLDGTDPRMRFSGAVAPAALEYSAPVPLSQTVPIRARALLRGTNWSALTEAAFTVGTLGSPLRLTEIQYNPLGGSPYEFLEIQNVSGVGVDLGGMRFSQGIDFLFNAGTFLAAGARLVLANDTDPAAFALRYPGVAVAGYFGGSLNNTGELLTLLDTRGQVVFSVNYDDANGWPVEADGSGRSLEVLNPQGDPNDPANWRASSNPNGSPGAPAILLLQPAIHLNEVLATNAGVVVNGATHPDYIELQNSSPVVVNMAGWSLSDDGNPGRYILPAGAVIQPGGYLVIWCDAPGSGPGFHSGFELDPDGEGVFLFDTLSNRVDAVTFGPQVPNYGLGRVGGSWQLTTPTPNAANVAALTGSPSQLVINEWLANAVPGQPDWVEIHNTSPTLPVPLAGLYLGTTAAVARVTSLSFIPPGGFVQWLADEGVGPRHLSLKLPAAGGAISLFDPQAQLVQRVSYSLQAEGVSQGRLPDGGAAIVSFPGTASPGAPNYLAGYSGPVINEVLARNVSLLLAGRDRPLDYVEIFNPTPTAFNMAGMSLSVGRPEPGQWVFPFESTVPPNGHLLLWCDGAALPSYVSFSLNLGRFIDGQSGGIYLFNSSGQLVNSVEYGPQLPDQSIGLSGGQWRLLAAPTPGETNAAPAPLVGPAAVRFNEWMANPAGGPDWFELFNGSNAPVDLSGLRLVNDLSLAGTNEFVIPRLSFIPARGFVQYLADADAQAGRHHVNFNLDADGEALRLYSSNGVTILDTVTFGAQLRGISEGRLPDGVTNLANQIRMPGTASPGLPNYRPVPGLVINEVLARAEAPLEQAIELHNAGSSPVDLGGWYLSNSRSDFRKYQLPSGTTIAAGGYRVFYEAAFGAGPAGFHLNPSLGDEIWLSQADAGGALTGARVRAEIGPSLRGDSLMRVATSVGVDYPPALARTFGQDTPGSVTQFRTGQGASNTAPRVGPLVINEIHYHPAPGAGSGDEYVEVHNLGDTAINLFDWIRDMDGWRLSGGVQFPFPPDATLAAGGFLLVVGFDPANAAAAAAFRARLGVGPSVGIFGPFQGTLGNSGDRLVLERPILSDVQGTLGFAAVDRVEYTDQVPWPTAGVDGGGLSLQRRSPGLYGNDPLHWVAAVPTPGTPNGSGLVPPPEITTQPAGQTLFEGASATLGLTARGSGPLTYQWRRDGIPIPAATNQDFLLGFALSEDSGVYDVIVGNPGGATVSRPFIVFVRVPPVLVSAPTNVVARQTTPYAFSALVRGDAPLAYQWKFNGVDLPGENGPTLSRTNAQVANEGTYELRVSNAWGSLALPATLVVLTPTLVTLPPVSQSVVVGGRVTLSVEFTGNPAPFNVEWRRITPPAITNSHVVTQPRDFLTFTAVTVPMTNQYRAIIRNQANPIGVASLTALIVTLADGDGDGLPDAWETQYGLQANNPADRNADLDGDGQSNWQEYLAGTDPTDPSSSLRVDLRTSPGAATVQFNAISNRTYTVQYSAGALGPWNVLGEVVARSTNRVEQLLDPQWSTNRYYRLLTPQGP